jgi:MFS family permease
VQRARQTRGLVYCGGVQSNPTRLPWLVYTELTALFLVQGAALAMWFVPLTNVLDAHGLHAIKPFAFATTGLAAFISPLFFGAMADRHTSPVTVLRGLALASAAAMMLASFAIQQGSPWFALAAIQLYSLCSSPAWSIASTVVFSGLRDARREFGPIRAVASLGWMAGCWVVSALAADASTLAGYSGAAGWLVVAGLTVFIPSREPIRPAGAVTLRERFGLDALTLLRNGDHRVVFITVALFNIPLSAFYPYSPLHLRELGFAHTTSWMTLGQITEILAMLALARLLTRWRLKWLIAAGLLLGVVRFALCALDTRAWLLAGIVLHGASFTLVVITAQIYLEQRIDPAWRARAQALMSLLVGGAGNLAGYLGVGWWFSLNTRSGVLNWPIFWGGLSIASGLVGAYFLIAYHGRGRGASAMTI